MTVQKTGSAPLAGGGTTLQIEWRHLAAKVSFKWRQPPAKPAHSERAAHPRHPRAPLARGSARALARCRLYAASAFVAQCRLCAASAFVAQSPSAPRYLPAPSTLSKTAPPLLTRNGPHTDRTNSTAEMGSPSRTSARKKDASRLFAALGARETLDQRRALRGGPSARRVDGSEKTFGLCPRLQPIPQQTARSAALRASKITVLCQSA